MLTDPEVIQRVLDGDTNLFEILVERYQNHVYGTVYRFLGGHSDVDDVAQEVFVTAYKNLGRFAYRSQFSTYLYRIAVNKCIDWARKNKRETSRRHTDILEEFPILDQLPDRDPSPEEAFIRKKERQSVQAILDDLPERYRSVLILYYYQELSYREMADVLDLPVRTVETRLYRARHAFEKHMKKEGEQHEK